MTDKPAENGPVEPAHDEPATLRQEADYADDAAAQPGHDGEPRPAGVDQDADDDRSTVRPTLQMPADEQITVEVPTERPTEPLDAAADTGPAEPAEPIEAAEPIEPAEANDPIEKADAADPIDPIERTEPIDPIDRTDPFEPIESSELSDRSDHLPGRDRGWRMASA